MFNIRICLLITLCFLCSLNGVAQTKKTPLHFIYIHGFGERRFPPAFEKRSKVFIDEEKLNASIETFYWDATKLNPFIVLSQWEQAKRNVLDASVAFSSTILAKYETLQESYVIVAYSLGCRVVASALTSHPQKLKCLQGLYFLGAAIHADERIKLDQLPQGLRIKSYHSSFDHSLTVSYRAMEGKIAGGVIGFSDLRIDNFRTACTHVYKGGPLKRDYSELYYPILSLELFRHGEKIPNGKLLVNWELAVGEGKYHWNDIYKTKIKNEAYLIQMNNNTDLFRLVWIKEDGGRIRKAWSKKLLPILQQLDSL